MRRTVLGLVGIFVITTSLLLPGPKATVAAHNIQDELSTRREICGYGPTAQMSQVREAALHEASALVASQQWPGIYWTFNDSGNTPTLFAVDEDGQPRGTFGVSNATNVDWEALQLGPDDDGGYALYIGDIGNNKGKRPDGVIYRVREPVPAPKEAQAAAGETVSATAFRFIYPVASRNAEAMLVHPKSAEVVLISRGEDGFNLVYRLPIPLDSRHDATLELVGVIDARSLGPTSGPITDAAISADARQVVLRTSSRALVYDVWADLPLARIWNQEPRIYRLEDGPKGEGVTYRFNNYDLVSISEGALPFLYETIWQC